MPSAVDELRRMLAERSDPRIAEATRRYFPEDIRALGVGNAEVRRIADEFVRSHPALGPEDRLALADTLVSGARHHEEVLLGFALIRKAVKRSFDRTLLAWFRAWIERSVWNWAQCDDLCLTVIYPFFLSRTHLILEVQDWTRSKSPWCRRAANVAWVKFVRLKVGASTYMLPIEEILANATRLMADPEPYVQKSVGWLLKVAAEHHPQAVIGFLERNVTKMQRDTFRYAIERIPSQQRKRLLALDHRPCAGGVLKPRPIAL